VERKEVIKYRTLVAPISVQLELTEKCTNNCIHCYNHWRVQNTNFVTLDKLQLNRVIDQLIANKVMHVILTGGEPLICSKLLIYAIKRLVEVKIDVSLNSNVTLLNHELALKLKSCGIQSILTSLLSWDENTHDKISSRKGAFQETIEGIKVAIDVGLRVSANMVLMQANFAHLYKTAQLAKDIGAKSFCATKVTPSQNAKDFDQLKLTKEQVFNSLIVLERIKNDLGLYTDILECYPLCLFGNISRFQRFASRSCSAGKTACTVGASGLVRPCSHADMTYGNVFSKDLSAIWKKMEDWRDTRYISEECKKCKFLAKCSGGCRMESKFYGDIAGKDPYMISSENVVNIPIKEKLSLISMDQPISFVKDLRLRQEDFGGMLYTKKTNSILLTKDSYSLVQSVKDKQSFTISDLTLTINHPINEMQKLFSILFKGGFIISVERR